MKRLITLFLVLTMVVTSLAAVTVSASADLSEDFVKTFVEQDSTKRADENLIKETPAGKDCYMLWSGADIGGRNHVSVDSTQATGVVDYDGKTRSMLQFTVSDKTPDPSGVINGLLFAKDGASRVYYSPADIKDGDKLVVSIYVKTKNEGTKTRFNMGFQNGPGYSGNAFTDTYGEDGMEVGDEWKQFKGVITVPDGYETDFAPTSYCLTMGYPGNMSGTMEEIVVSNPYVAKAEAVDIKTELSPKSVKPGETAEIKTEVLNQLGTTAGVSQDITYYVTNADRTEILADSGITVAADGKIIVSDSAEDGSYGIVAVAGGTMVSGKILTVNSGKPADLTEDFVKTYVSQSSSRRADDNLIKNTAGNDDCYMLWSGADIGGRNTSSLDALQALNIVDFDGKTRSMLYLGGFSSQTVNPALGIEGVLVAKDGAARTYYNPSDIKGGDRLLVSVYVKTKNEGAKTRFNMGFQNGAGYGYNAFTDTYGEDGMEVGDEWKQFTGVITMPDDYSALISTSYSLTMGYPTTMSDKMEELLISNPFIAKVKAVDIEAEIKDSVLKQGESTSITAKILNQLGTTAGVSQDITYYVTNADRTEILADSGITVAADGTVTAAEDAKSGSYCIVAVSDANKKMIKGAKLNVGSEFPDADLTEDYFSNYSEQTSAARAPENLVKTTDGNDDCYMLWSAADMFGRNSTSVDMTQVANVVDYDGKTRNMLGYILYNKKTSPSDHVIEGSVVAKDPSTRVYYDPSDIKDGDKILVSIYVKTKNEGTTTRFNMGFVMQDPSFGYNAYTDTYGKDGMEVTDTWKRFVGVITIPKGYTKDCAGNSSYGVHMGYPSSMTGDMEEMLVSNLYMAKLDVKEFVNAFADSETSLEKGASKTIYTKLVNQAGTTDGLEQKFKYVVTNEERTEILTDSGITVTPGNTGEATVSVASDAKDGSYYVISISKYGQVMAQPVLIGTGLDPTLTELNYYVSNDGKDTNNGTIDAPFKTLDKAKSQIRKIKDKTIPITVYIRGGLYQLSKTFTLEAQDGGSDEHPVTYKAYNGENVVLTTSSVFSFSDFKPLTGDMKDYLKADVKDKIYVANASDIGLDPIDVSPANATFGINAPLMMLDNQAMSLSRYPNSDVIEDWMKADAVTVDTNTNAKPVLKVYDDNLFKFSYRPEDFVYYGYIAYGWCANSFTAAMDTDNNVLNGTSGAYYGASADKGKPIRVFNAFEAIDEPGEWYYDKSSGKLYIYPFEGTNENSKLFVTTNSASAVSVSGAKNINIEGIRMTTSRKYVLSLTDVENITINNCIVNNSVDYGINVDGAYNVTIKNSVINHTGNEAIYMYGGDLETLKPGGNRITNNVIHDTNKLQEFNIPAVNTRGVGTKIDHNEFYNTPLMAIAFALAGNERTSVDTVIEYNEFHDCLRNGVDLGVIYGGRDMRAMNNTIRYNHFHDNSCNYSAYGFSASAVFVDDYVGFTTVEHNIIGPGMSGVNTEAFKVNQGQGNVFNANLIIDLPSLFYQYDWGDEWPDYVNRLAREGTWGADAPTTLAKVWENDTWTARWPWIKEYYDGKGTRTNTTLSNNVMIYTNSDPHSVSWMHEFDDCYYIYRFGTPWASDEPALTGFPTNLIMTKKNGTDNRNLFVDYAGGNYNLKPEVLAKAPGFTNIDQSEIGIKTFEYDGNSLLPGDEKPIVTNVTLSGVPKKGKELSVSYKFESPDGHKNGRTYANYYITDTADEDFYLNFKKVSDNTGTSEFTVTPECEGRYIRCKVTPVDENGAVGKAVWAEPLYIEPAGDVDKDALYELNDEAKAFYNSVEIGDGEGKYPKSEADLMKAALDKTAEVLSSQSITQYMIDEQYKALESAFKRFKKSVNVSADVTRVNIKPFITAGENSWQIMKNDVKYEFTGGALHMHSGYGLAAYTGEKFKNTEFAFRYKQNSVNSDDWGGFVIGQADPSSMPWAGNSGVLVVCKREQLELQFYDGVNSPNAADGTFVAKKGDYIENDKTYDITFGMYDVNGTTVRVVLTIDGETIFDEQRAIPELVSREGHFCAIAATNTEITLSGANVDKSALKAALDEAKSVLDNAQAGTDYNQYSAADIAKLKAAYDSAKAAYDDDKTAEHEVDRAAYALSDALSAFRKTAVTEKNFTADGSVDLNYDVDKSTFKVSGGVKAEVKGADKALPEIDSTSDGISMNIPNGTKLTAKDWNGTLRLPSAVSSPSGKAGSLKIGKVFALGAEKPIASDGWVKLVLTGLKDEKLAYLNESGNYRVISDKAGTEPMYRETEGNDAVIYTKLLTEIVTYTTGGSGTETPDEPSAPSGGGTVTNPYGGNKGGTTAGGNGFYSNDTTNPSISNPFTDMVNHWAAADVLAMNKAGIVSGVSDTLFDPDRNITRAEFAAIIARALKLSDKTADFKDVNGEWFAPYVGACSDAGIITGYDGYFRPSDNITRQEMAVIIVNAYSYLEKTGANGGIDNFTDKAEIADWAKAAVDTASSVGLISGMGDGTFSPSSNATRAQAASIVKRLLDK